MCVHPEDAVTGLQEALKKLYSNEYWEAVPETHDYIDQFKGITTKCIDLTSDIESLLAGIREEANERARAA